MPGTGHLTVTGQLGDVMKESAMAAMSYVRTHSPELGLEDDYFQTHDIHIHVPAGAIPKDGPSAGVTMATAICSLVTGTPVNNDVAMTGEVTLTGQVLPIGGLKEKTLAAQRAGITTVILPSRNEADLEDVPEELRKGMTFIPVDRVEQVWEAAMGLRLDERAAQLIEAGDLIEEAGELLEKARRKAGSRVAAAAAGGTNGSRGRRSRRRRSRRPRSRRPRSRPRPAAGGKTRAAQGGAGQAQGRRQEDHRRARPQRPQEVAAAQDGRGPRSDGSSRGGAASPARSFSAGAAGLRSCLGEAGRIRWRGPAPASPARSSRRDHMADQPSTHESSAEAPRVASAATLTRAVPSFAVLLVADVAAVWAAVGGSWTALVVVVVCVIDGLGDGIFAWLRARASFAAGSATDSRDQILVREFLRTYLVVIGVQAIVAYMVFGGLLLKPGGKAPLEPGAPFATWQFWAVVAGLVAHARASCTGGTSCAAAKPP